VSVIEFPLGWVRVSFAADVDEDCNCSLCGEDYGECACPGPTMEQYEYREIGGRLYARLIPEYEEDEA